MKIKVDRDSVCMGDDMEGHSKIYQLDNNATYKDLFNILKEDHYFPNIAGNNVVWVLTTKRIEWIFSYFTKTDKFSEGLCEKYMRNICDPSGEVFLQYYSSPEKWKNKILEMYHGDSYAMWRDGWVNELKYCDEIIDIVGSMNHDINLNIPYTAPEYIWDKIGEVYESMPYWKGDENEPKWVGPDIYLWASVESGGIQIAGRMPDEMWENWYASLKQKLKNALNHEIGEPEDGVDFYKFIPRDIEELYEALQKEDLKGKLAMEDGWLIWRLPNNIILKIYIWNHPHEGYIDTYYLKNGKEMCLTHWHPMDDEVYSDLMDINNGRTIWIKKKSFFGDQYIIMDRKEYEAMSDKKKRKYHFWEGV